MDGISGQKFSLPQPKKIDTRKKNEVMSQGDERTKGITEDKKDTGLLQIKYCPPERDDNLNISKEGLNLIKNKDKKSDVTLEEIREKILNRPEEETPIEKIEEFVSGFEGLDKDKKIDFPSILEGTPEEMEISKNVFRKLSESGERRKIVVSERGLYMRSDADKEEASELWMYDGSGPGSVPVSKEKTPEETDQKRIYNESHKIMEKLGGKDRAEEEVDNVMGGKIYKEYGVVKDDKEISFTENYESIYKDKNGNPKKDSSETIITRNSDGSYVKSYNREDSDRNSYITELKTNQDGSTERTSETILKDNEDDTKFTKINSTETKDKDGNRLIVSEEVRPDGTKIYKEKTLDKDGNGKVVIKETKVDGKVITKERETGNVPEEVSDGDCVYTGIEANISIKAGEGDGGYPAGIEGNFGGELKPSNNAGGEEYNVSIKGVREYIAKNPMPLQKIINEAKELELKNKEGSGIDKNRGVDIDSAQRGLINKSEGKDKSLKQVPTPLLPQGATPEPEITPTPLPSNDPVPQPAPTPEITPSPYKSEEISISSNPGRELNYSQINEAYGIEKQEKALYNEATKIYDGMLKNKYFTTKEINDIYTNYDKNYKKYDKLSPKEIYDDMIKKGYIVPGKSDDIEEMKKALIINKIANSLKSDNKFHISSQISQKLKNDPALEAYLPENQISTGILDSERKIDYLVQDNHPEKILGDGVGLIGKHTVPPEDSDISPGTEINNLLTSYHQNLSNNDNLKIAYNFTATEDDTKLTFNRANFSVDSTGVKAGALATGENFTDGKTNGLMENAYFKDSNGNIIRIDDEKLKELTSQGKILEEDGKIIINLAKNETFSFEAQPQPEKKGDKSPAFGEKSIFASAIEFSNDNQIDVEISSLPENASKKDRFENKTHLPDNDGNLYNSWTDGAIEGKIDKINEDIKTQTNILNSKKARLEEKVEAFIIKENLEGSKQNVLNIKNTDKYNSPQQVSGVFKNPTYEVTGNIEPGEIFKVPPAGTEITNERETNKGAFSQNYYYELEIENYNSEKNYEAVLVPGGGTIAYHCQPDGFGTNIAHPNSSEQRAITLPSKIISKDVNGERKYYLTFDYFVIGGSAGPNYGTVMEADK